jgi:hypothetical protein
LVRLDHLTVTLGTDTFPGNLYVLDAQSAGIRVRLAAPPPVPFQPGDVVSVVGTPALVDGEVTLDGAVARLTNIAPMSALPEPVLVHIADLVAGKVGVGQAAQVRGVVVLADRDHFEVEEQGSPIAVPLAGRKEFSIESTGLDLSPPVGAQVQVTGIVARRAIRDTTGRPTVSLLPRSAADVVVLSSGTPVVRAGWARLLVILITIGALIVVGFWFRRHRRPQHL